MSFYEPEEDSFLMSGFIGKSVPKLASKNNSLKFLEIGSGSGINLKAALKSGINKRNILSSDINIDAVLNCRKLGFKCILSNLFEKIPKKEKFDVIIFNPPYLPLDKSEPINSQTATTGGKKGNEITIKFLKQAKDYLSKKGIVFIITSSLAQKINFSKLGYKLGETESKNLFFEKLSCIQLSLI